MCDSSQCEFHIISDLGASINDRRCVATVITFTADIIAAELPDLFAVS
jgi:hypothetical protein